MPREDFELVAGLGREVPTLLEVKVCSACGDEKSIKGFHRDATRPDGRRDICKECRKQGKKVSNDMIQHALNHAAYRLLKEVTGI